MNNAIEIKGLTKKFKEKVAVNNITLSIPKNGIFSLLGVNGAGKTTTIKILSGLSKSTSGTASVYGYDVNEALEEIKKISNVSPQETAVAPNLTVRENLQFISEIYGKNKVDAKKDVDQIIEQFSLEEVEKSRAKTLSGGWQRKVSIAMAVITRPQVLFLDEPTVGLDVLARRELWKVIEKIKETTTIILTTHYMEEAEMLSDNVAVMIDGRIKAVGTVEELKKRTSKESLEEAFVAIAEEEEK